MSLEYFDDLADLIDLKNISGEGSIHITSLKEISLSFTLFINNFCSEIDKIALLLNRYAKDDTLYFLSEKTMQSQFIKSAKTINNLAESLIPMLALELQNDNTLYKHSIILAMNEIKDIKDAVSLIMKIIKNLQLQHKDINQDKKDFINATQTIISIDNMLLKNPVSYI